MVFTAIESDRTSGKLIGLYPLFQSRSQMALFVFAVLTLPREVPKAGETLCLLEVLDNSLILNHKTLDRERLHLTSSN